MMELFAALTGAMLAVMFLWCVWNGFLEPLACIYRSKGPRYAVVWVLAHLTILYLLVSTIITSSAIIAVSFWAMLSVLLRPLFPLKEKGV